MIKLIAIFVCFACYGCDSTQDFSIDFTYDEGHDFVDFYERVGEKYVIGGKELGLLQQVLAQSEESIKQTGYQLFSKLEPQISGQFSTMHKGSLKSTLFKAFVFNYNKTSGQFQVLVVYFDSNTKELVALACPKNTEQNLSCSNIEYPSDRGALLSFD